MKSASETTFHIETLGCPKNRVDSRRMRTSLLRLGYREAPQADKADIFLINSCSFIREAQEETIQTVFDTLKIREKKSPAMKIGMVGCFVERFSDAVKNDIPELDFTIGTQRYHEVGTLISEKFNIQPSAHAAALNDTMSGILPPARMPSLAALNDNQASNNADSSRPFVWLRIAQGCDRKCAFCIIPTIRGGLKTYSITDIERQYLDEAELRRGGSTNQPVPMREIVLVSQDTISQGVDEIEQIVAHLSAKDEVHWIRLQYLFPDRRVLDLLKLWEKYPKLVPYLDIPFQHVSPEILKAMKRPSDTALFSEILERARAIRSDFEIRTSFIIGFPGETQKHYAELVHFIQNNRIDKLALFRYSHEVGTTAGDQLTESVDDDEKYRRINELRDLHLETRKQYALGLLGSTEIMIVDEIVGGEITLRRAHDAPESDEIVTAALPAGLKPEPGQMIPVTLKAYTEYSFIGEVNSGRPAEG